MCLGNGGRGCHIYIGNECRKLQKKLLGVVVFVQQKAPRLQQMHIPKVHTSAVGLEVFYIRIKLLGWWVTCTERSLAACLDML